MRYASGDKYIGQFSENKRHVKGHFFCVKSGISYDGDWITDK